MIDKVLDVLKKTLHEYLIRLPELNIAGQDTVRLTHVINPQDGNLGIPPESLGLSLINIEEEKSVKPQNAITKAPDGRISHVNPELLLNLYILIAANCAEYTTSLEYLSGAIRFFQSKQVFTPENTPGLDPSIQKFIVELYTLNLEQQHHLWGILGGKYLPSVMYKIRLISIQEAHKQDEQPPIRIIEASTRGM